MTSSGPDPWTLSPRLAAAGVVLACLVPTPVPAELQKPMPIPAGTPRFAVIAERTTIGLGEAMAIKLELQDARGRRMNAPSDIDMVLTVTTLPSLQRAREEAAKVNPRISPAAPASLDHRRVLLPAGQSVLRAPATFPRGAGAVDFEVTSQPAGDLSIYVEAVGPFQVQPGSALIIATEQLRRMRREEAAAVHRIVWRPPQRPGGTRLKFKDSGLDVVLEGRDFVRPFSVGLQDENGRWVLPPSGTPLTIQLSVMRGSANFDRRSLVIDPADPISRDQTKLRSSVGGTIEMAAQSVDRDIADAREPFTYELGARATRLDVQPVSTSALANGLDAITVDVRAMYDDGVQPARILTAAQEGLADRRVLLTFAGGSATQKSTELIIPKHATSQSIDVVSSRASRHLEVNAKSINGFQQPISGKTNVEFSLPWSQLAGAVAGGLLLPAIFGATRRGVDPAAAMALVLGGLGGALLYMLMFFGAVVTGEYSLGRLAVNLTRLPTENVLAAFVLGLIGYLVISPALPKPPGHRKPPAPKRTATPIVSRP